MIKLCDLGMKYTKKRIRGGSTKIWETQKKASFQKGTKQDKIIKRGSNTKNKKVVIM